ncbi:hypothetical protein H6768_05680 [Candidatus Peribacteria bacterium]|nr:hypothetical protein [Candidatus Peribacteria bacterium]
MNKINPPTFDKVKARKIAQDNIALLSSREKIEASEKVCEQLRTIIEQIQPHTIITYKALSDEVDISSLIHVFPALSIITVDQDGSFLEFTDDIKVLALIPGRAFTQNGKRIGRGSGYYDNFIAEHPKMKTV